ncbi:type II secretion system protein GspM [Pseudomonas sp. HR96]|uniref:type II secretion system protein GspM n=1 Tax=Pseudomonas sp. HR96 TaxID=1027966 RepID=UPI002A7582D3|nr:type II secretion system protein GspM [Pseudomonas sp. HR96]WPO98445.1 type II secretion system protein GspM [Pseudomonas sp. HR96]
MRRPLKPLERQMGALLLLALLLWSAWYLLIDSWFAAPMAELDAQAQGLQEQHQRYAQLLAQGPALQAALEQARSDPASQRSLLAGDDANGAAADLMQYAVERVNAQAGKGPGCVVSQRMPIVPPQDPAVPYRQVKVSLTLACGTEPLLRLLAELEYGQPVVFVEDLSLHGSVGPQGAGGPGRLKVQLLLRGYLTASAAVEPRS